MAPYVPSGFSSHIPCSFDSLEQNPLGSWDSLRACGRVQNLSRPRVNDAVALGCGWGGGGWGLSCGIPVQSSYSSPSEVSVSSFRLRPNGDAGL